MQRAERAILPGQIRSGRLKEPPYGGYDVVGTTPKAVEIRLTDLVKTSKPGSSVRRVLALFVQRNILEHFSDTWTGDIQTKAETLRIETEREIRSIELEDALEMDSDSNLVRPQVDALTRLYRQQGDPTPLLTTANSIEMILKENE